MYMPEWGGGRPVKSRAGSLPDTPTRLRPLGRCRRAGGSSPRTRRLSRRAGLDERPVRQMRYGLVARGFR